MQQLVSGLTASYYTIQLSTPQKAEIGHFQSRQTLWVSRQKVITVNCWICWRGEHYNHVSPDKAVLKQTKSYPHPRATFPFLLAAQGLWLNWSLCKCLVFNMSHFHKNIERKDVAPLTLSADGEIAHWWYPSLWLHIVLQPERCIKSNKEPLQANVITPHPCYTRLSIRRMALM